ncbi:hypothetical protein OH76DRAFT_1404626 [Lentinus brumalis]|uniref:Uncharacterized protein n=1 Tax=Lentinus brumalis TaxID=2498619 RepID=A0A371D845_9APHY|nr:hypothetical protein OH76DRAFT_1404626 [Polyporus brumalis]
MLRTHVTAVVRTHTSRSIIERSLRRMIKSGRSAAPCNSFAATGDDALTHSMDIGAQASGASPLLSTAGPGLRCDAAIAVESHSLRDHIVATTQHELPIPCEDVQRNGGEQLDSTAPMKRKERPDSVERSDRPRKQRVLYWPFLAIVRVLQPIKHFGIGRKGDKHRHN